MKAKEQIAKRLVEGVIVAAAVFAVHYFVAGDKTLGFICTNIAAAFAVIYFNLKRSSSESFATTLLLGLAAANLALGPYLCFFLYNHGRLEHDQVLLPIICLLTVDTVILVFLEAKDKRKKRKEK